MFRKARAQVGEHARAVPTAFKGNDNVNRMAHEPEGSHSGSRAGHHAAGIGLPRQKVRGSSHQPPLR